MAAQALPAGYGLQEYRIEKLLGVGGFGLTYLALDQNLNLKVALKEYLPGDIAQRAADQSITPSSAEWAESFGWGKRRFLDESRTLASFRHPNIVRVMRFFEANGSAYMVMEFVAGAPLGDWIKSQQRPLPEAHLRALAMPLLDGLEVVHKAGYAHRDVKPGNIYMREDDSPVLLDFGSPRIQESERLSRRPPSPSIPRSSRSSKPISPSISAQSPRWWCATPPRRPGRTPSSFRCWLPKLPIPGSAPASSGAFPRCPGRPRSPAPAFPSFRHPRSL